MHLLTLAPTGVWATLVRGGAPTKISKTKQARDKRQTALDTDGQALQFSLWSFLGQVKNDVTGVKKWNGGTRGQGSVLPITFELTELVQN